MGMAGSRGLRRMACSMRGITSSIKAGGLLLHVAVGVAASRGVRGRDRRVPRRGSRAAARLPTAASRAAHPERCLEAYYLQRTRFEGIVERKIRRRQLTDDGNVEISGRDLRQVRGATCADRQGASQIGPFSATQPSRRNGLFLPAKRSLVETLPSTPEQRDKGGNE